MDNNVKILFRFYSEVLEEETVETMWAVTIDQKKGLYKLDNIPFYVPLISSDDVVYAEYDENESMLTYRSTIEYSGNSTIRIVAMDKDFDMDKLIKDFNLLGCISEKLSERYLAMEVPKGIDYKGIKQRLRELEETEVIGYEESCLSDEHRH